MTPTANASPRCAAPETKLRRWGAGFLALGMGVVLVGGTAPVQAHAADQAPLAGAWTPGPLMPAKGLSAQNVGFHADQPAVQDQSALPVHAKERAIVKVTDFGADPTGRKDSAKAVNDAILYAKSLKKPATIVFPCGSYSMYPEAAPQRELYVSNTVGADQAYANKSIGLLLEDMHDVIVDGMGSALTFHGNQTQIAAIRSSDVTVQNLDTDWYAPGTLDLTVLTSGVAGGHGYRDIKVPAGVNYAISGASATFTGETSPVTGQPYWTHAPSGASAGQNQIRDLASGLTLRSGLPLWTGSSAVADLGGGVLRVSYTAATDPGGAGKVYEMRKTTRDTPGSFIWESTRTALSNMKMHYLHGFGIVGQFSHDISMDKITLRTDPGTDRQTASFADFVQMSGVAGKVQITNSLFDNPHDDPINIHGTYVEVKALDRAARTVTLQYMHNETAGFPQFYPGDELRFVKKATMLPEGAATFKVVSVDGPSGTDSSHSLTQMTVTVDGDLPANLAVSQFVAENLTYTPEVYVAGNTFQSVPTRGILVTTPKPVLIERNIFDQMGMASIYISADAASWYESGGVEDVKIRNNVFDRPATGSATIFVDPTNSQNEDGKAVHHDISIEANRFSLLSGGQLVSAKSVSGLEFTANAVNHYSPTAPVSVTSSKPLFSFSGSSGVLISGNSYEPGFNLRANTSAMAAAEVDGAGDGVLTNADNVTAVNVPKSTLAAGMGWVREDPSRWAAVNKDTVTLKAGVNGLWATQNAAVNILRQDVPAVGDTDAVVKLSGATKSQYEEAGLILYADDDNYVALERKHANGSPVLALVTEAAGQPNENTQVAAPPAADVWLKISRTGNAYTASYSTDGTAFTVIGSITNAAVGNNGRVGVLAAGTSTGDTAFNFSALTVKGVAQPFFGTVVEPAPATLLAAIDAPTWSGVQFAAPVSPLAWMANTDAATATVSARFKPGDAGTKLQVQFNDVRMEPAADGSYAFDLMSGPNVVQVQTLGADGVSSQTYRWVIVSALPAKAPGSNVVCAPVVEPTPEPTVEPTATPEPTAEPTTEPTVDPTMTATPSVDPTTNPTIKPTTEPTVEPTAEPTAEPTVEQTVSATPTADPTMTPTAGPKATSAATATASATVSPSMPEGENNLASTGAALWPAVGGAVVVLAGLVLLVMGRRRRA
ncbi:DUF1349 domain-containing protein [Arthrobacter sp. ERGS1:01]|uniref:DUF1349 domain-containing protein n=1 Tax=Arthrobacter sp. ERGS1:01 TaxID=1704044 RepID=UPI0009EB62F4|nr:DUF1349 domain-containing protein [Arthrobacter sp. ERGS1:01]